MSERYRIADVDELATDGARIIREVENREIAVFNHEGEYYALLNFCVHQGGPLCEGTLQGRTTIADNGWMCDYDEEEKNIACPWHGWVFDITTGESLDTDQYSVPTYDIEVDDGELFVRL